MEASLALGCPLSRGACDEDLKRRLLDDLIRDTSREPSAGAVRGHIDESNGLRAPRLRHLERLDARIAEPNLQAHRESVIAELGGNHGQRNADRIARRVLVLIGLDQRP